MLFDLVEGGLAEVLAAEEFVLGAGGEFADGVDVEPLEGLAGADGEFEVGDGLGEHFGGNVAGNSRAAGAGGTTGSISGFVQRLAKAKALGSQQRLDLVEGGFAEVLVREKFLLAGLEEVAERADVHLLEAVARADGKLEVGDGDFEDGVAAGEGALVIGEVHGPGGLDVLHIEAGAGVIGVGAEDGVEAAVGFLVVVVVFVEDREVEQRIDVNRLRGGQTLVKLDGLGVFGLAIVKQSEGEAGGFVVGVLRQSPLVELHSLVGLAGGLGFLGLFEEFLGGTFIDGGDDSGFAHRSLSLSGTRQGQYLRTFPKPGRCVRLCVKNG